ncbi:MULTISPECIES: helix-turn-helix domain-containing protein [Streptomyces]|uniref:IclR family mhp operon transcriptional activator n=1 Tax=Streptomyces stelliscabiei TaxID=146820 RepID=A0A8I0TNC2_9ACTN|nr:MULTISPECIES: IclR family transcriptional regulator C-terminal domain-containing protein [Streptomyces]MBE1594067.1 IclR family mhp operon transcriptional activator [Streptomyces stelliscabiei]MDX2520365.1 IclR family transcriptional regulator C-terminal domain-containing protein [Streptomyces stelliscabiei]MDX3274859.1 IclR family transcriptional regulator C-terminal domain-containing protein [Streptomyces scabiei]
MRQYQVKTISSLERGLQVLKALEEMRAASLHDLHQVTGIPKATLIRILHTCNQQGLVWQRLADGAFVASLRPQRAPYNDVEWLGELASSVLEELCERVMWPSVLTVPRLDYMETIDTNSPKAYFDEVVPVAPIGFRSHMLLGASGRAYIAFCAEREREAVLRRLREHDAPGNAYAHDPGWLRRLLATTRSRGYSVRAPEYDFDGRNSIAVPIRLHGEVLGCVNVTWRKTVMSAQEVARRHLDDLRAAVHRIEERASAAVPQRHGPGGDEI